ncbi:MAG TPA: DUF4832 domain-containing protein [Aggregatilineales bacterium]|nr:DUF4832 domain-containing protein [Aggregatilineales bacterium]
MKRQIALCGAGCLVLILMIVCFKAFPAGAQPKQAGQSSDDPSHNWTLLDYAPAPADNPLKGFMPFYDAYGSMNAPIANDFPHSMEYFYVPLRDLMNGPNSFTFETGIEPQLQSIASRGDQAVLRVYLDYPTRSTGIPQFLLDGGLKVHKYTVFGNTMQPWDSVSPDYDDPNLVTAMTAFIAEFGRRYDGDPRIGFIELGLIGFWGEWHTWPMNGEDQETALLKARPDTKVENWMPSDQTQEQVIKSYAGAFTKTRLLMRYPVLPPAGEQASPGRLIPYGSMKYNIGYHDDSFAYNTLFGLDWYFMGRLQWTGGINKWKTAPIGGELRPEIQLSLWIDPPSRNDMEDFSTAVDDSHVSWLIAHSLYVSRSVVAGTPIYKAAVLGAQHMGYEFTISAVKLPNIQASDPLQVDLRIQNRGVAPFYYDWPLELGVLDRTGNLVATYSPGWTLSSLLPSAAGQAPYTEWTYSNSDPHLMAGTYTLLLHVINPLSNGKPLKFANATQDANRPGWLTLGTFNVQ